MATPKTNKILYLLWFYGESVEKLDSHSSGGNDGSI